MDAWHFLRSFTQARIAQGSAGSGQRTESLMDFLIAHAEARDAVWQDWDTESFVSASKNQLGIAHPLLTQISQRSVYLQRPDLGQKLMPESLSFLHDISIDHPCDVALIVSNGLSTTAVEHHALPLLRILLDLLARDQLVSSPILVVANARVALSDEIGQALKAKVSLILIGERPGLSAADSLGAYMTLDPLVGNTNAERNCISNIREPEGLSYRQAAEKIIYLILKGLRTGTRGVALKDDFPEDQLTVQSTRGLSHR